MNSIAQIFGIETEPQPLREAFLRWQCRVRMIAMREHQGRPDGAISPTVTLANASEPMGEIVTVLCKLPAYSKTPEMRHMVQKTFDPAHRRDKAIELFSETYYQKGREFSDILTAVFPEGSPGAQTIRKAQNCRLYFDAYGQSFDISCKIWKLASRNPLYQASWWHNHLFNPTMSKKAVILGFEPDWSQSTAEPPFPDVKAGEI